MTNVRLNKDGALLGHRFSRRRLLEVAAVTAPLIALGPRAFAAEGNKVERPFKEIATGLRFPEGPMVAPGGGIMVSEIEAGRVTRIMPDGTKEIISEPGGGPNGLAIGPNGKIYCCNGGGYKWSETDGILSIIGIADDNEGGRIDCIDPKSGKVKTLYEEANGHRLRDPNDIVFDNHGGFWFSDSGTSLEREHPEGGIYYAKADGSGIREVKYPFSGANGIGISPDGKRLIVAVMTKSEIWEFNLTGPGEIDEGRLLTSVTGLPDSLAIEANGNICVGILVEEAGVKTISPAGELVEHLPFSDILTTNICFGGAGMKTAHITLSLSGSLVQVDWPRAGLKLKHVKY